MIGNNKNNNTLKVKSLQLFYLQQTQGNRGPVKLGMHKKK
jgi:hypothetical protein